MTTFQTGQAASISAFREQPQAVAQACPGMGNRAREPKNNAGVL